MEVDEVNNGKKLFIAIVTITIILRLAPSFPTIGSGIESIISRLIFPIAGIILYSFLVYETYKGHKWARITLAVSYLVSLILSVPTVLYLMSFMQKSDFIILTYEMSSILFAIFSATALLKSKSLIAFLETNQNHHHQGNIQLPGNVHDGEFTAKSGIFTRLKKTQIHQVVFGFGLFILFTQYIWKLFYVGGILPGFYWLFYYLDDGFFVLIKVVFILAGVVFLSWIFSKFFIKDYSTQLIKIVGALVFTGAAIAVTFPIVIARNTVFIEKLQVENKVYYLSAYPMFAEVNYSVAECEFTGQLCRTIFVSGDITGTNWLNSHLKYNENRKEIVLVEDEEGVIFSKVAP